MDDRTQAHRWLDAHGFADGSVWRNADGERIGDLLRDEFGDPDQLWTHDHDPRDATAMPAYIFGDGSAVLLTYGWWDIVDEVGRCGSGLAALTDDEIDEQARDSAPEGWSIMRGSYLTTSDDRADRLYAQRDTDEMVDHRGRGAASIAEALTDTAEQVTWDESTEAGAAEHR